MPLGHKTRSVRTFGRCNFDAQLENLRSASWESDSVDINVRWNLWKTVFFGILDKHVPIIICRIRRNPLPWIDSAIRKLMRRRNWLRRLANRVASEEAWKSYRALRNTVTWSLRQGKSAYVLRIIGIKVIFNVTRHMEAAEQAPGQEQRGWDSG